VSRRLVHFDQSDDAWMRSLCGATPNAKGTNLSSYDAQVTCPRCLRALGYEIPEAEEIAEELARAA
jgi:hypothetical protein